MKATVILDHPNLKPVFNVGDEVEIVSVRYEEDTVLHNGVTLAEHVGWFKGKSLICEPIIAPKGSLKGLQVVTKDGNTYDTNQLINMIGYIPVNLIFKKCS